MFLKMKYQIMINGSIGRKIPMNKSIMLSLWATPPNLMSALASLSIKNGSVSLTALLMLSCDFCRFNDRTTPPTTGLLSGLTLSFRA